MRRLNSIFIVAVCAFMGACGQSEPRDEAVPPTESAPPISAHSPTPLDPGDGEAEEGAAPADPAAEAAPSQATAQPEPQTAPESAPVAPAQTAAAARPAAFARCQACHSVEPGGGHGIGPNLVGVMGAAVGSRPGYDYSDGMAGFGQSWTPALLDAFLQSPRDTVPGTKMMAAPIRDPAERQALIDYLEALR